MPKPYHTPKSERDEIAGALAEAEGTLEYEADCGHAECTQWLIDADAEHGAEYALREAICVVAERAEDEAYYAADAAATRREE